MVLSPLRAGPAHRPGGEVRRGGGGRSACMLLFLSSFCSGVRSFLPRFVADVAQ